MDKVKLSSGVFFLSFGYACTGFSAPSALEARPFDFGFCVESKELAENSETIESLNDYFNELADHENALGLNSKVSNFRFLDCRDSVILEILPQEFGRYMSFVFQKDKFMRKNFDGYFTIFLR